MTSSLVAAVGKATQKKRGVSIQKFVCFFHSPEWREQQQRERRVWDTWAAAQMGYLTVYAVSDVVRSSVPLAYDSSGMFLSARLEDCGGGSSSSRRVVKGRDLPTFLFYVSTVVLCFVLRYDKPCSL